LYLNREGKTQTTQKGRKDMYLEIGVRPYLVKGNEEVATKTIKLIERAGLANNRPLLASGIAPEPRGENVVIFVAGTIGNLKYVIEETLEINGVNARMLSDEEAESILKNITEDDIYR